MKGGIWILCFSDFATSSSNIEEGLKKIRGAGFSLILPLMVSGDGLLNYQTKIGTIRESFKNWDPLDEICKHAQRLNLKVHPCVEVFTDGEPSPLLKRNPDVRLVDIFHRKDYEGWVCAMRPEVQEYKLSLCQEILENYPVDGVHLDVIRGGTNCYCDYCQTEIKKKTGVDRLEISGGGQELCDSSKDKDGEYYEIWMNWREENVTNFVERVSRKANEVKKEVSVAVLTHYPWQLIEQQGQNWKDWADKKLVDYIIPMTYTNCISALSCHPYDKKQEVFVSG